MLYDSWNIFFWWAGNYILIVKSRSFGVGQTWVCPSHLLAVCLGAEHLTFLIIFFRTCEVGWQRHSKSSINASNFCYYYFFISHSDSRKVWNADSLRWEKTVFSIHRRSCYHGEMESGALLKEEEKDHYTKWRERGQETTDDLSAAHFSVFLTVGILFHVTFCLLFLLLVTSTLCRL